MTNRLYRWSLVAGALLLLLAALLILHLEQPREGVSQAQRARLVSTLARLEGCQTCHAAPSPQLRLLIAASDSPPVSVDYLRAVMAIPPSPDDPSAAAPVTALPEPLRAELRQVGQRLLDLSGTGEGRAQAAVASYLALAESALADPAAADLGSLWAALQALGLRVRELEHAAGPVQWRAPVAADPLPDAGAGWAIPLAPLPVAWILLGAVLVMAVRCRGQMWGGRCARLPREIVAAVRRRGPPELMRYNRCLRGRLALCTAVRAQSSFFAVLLMASA